MKNTRVTLKYLASSVVEILKKEYQIDCKSAIAYRTYNRSHEIEAGAAQIIIKIDLNTALPLTILVFDSCQQIQKDLNDGYKLHLKPRSRGYLQDSELTVVKI